MSGERLREAFFSWRGAVLCILLLGPLAGAGMGYGLEIRSASARHATDTATLVKALLPLYLIGREDEAYEELRHFVQTYNGDPLSGVELLSLQGNVKNFYPAQFPRSERPTVLPVVGADGVERDRVALHYASKWPPVGWPLMPWALGGSFLATLGFLTLHLGHSERLRRDAQIALRDARITRQEAQITKMGAVWDDYRALLSDESGRMANHLQELSGFISQLKTNLADVVHDMRKAPLLGIGTGELGETQELIDLLRDPGREFPREALIQFVKDVDQTMEAIQWVVSGLPEYANFVSEPVHIQEQLRLLCDNLPPAIHRKCAPQLEMPGEAQWALFNNFHFRSVMKNALYNASTAIQKAIVAKQIKSGSIRIRCLGRGEEVGVIIEDNGPGLSADALRDLYRGQVRHDDPRRGKGSIIVASYLSLHEARVEVQNRHDGGAKVTFWFKRTEPSGSPDRANTLSTAH